MKRTKKRFLAMIMSLALLLGLLPAMSGSAAAATMCNVTGAFTNVKAADGSGKVLHNGDSTQVESGSSFTANLSGIGDGSPDGCYVIPDTAQINGTTPNVVYADPETPTENYYNKLTGKLYIANVTGDMTITASSTLKTILMSKMTMHPECGEKPVTSLTGEGGSAVVSWSPSVAENGRFAANTSYTATITVTADAGYAVKAAKFYLDDHSDELDVTEGKTEQTLNEYTLTFPATGSQTKDELAETLANQIMGEGVSIVPGSAKFDLIASQKQGATFNLDSTADAEKISALDGLSSGIILSSGNAKGAVYTADEIEQGASEGAKAAADVYYGCYDYTESQDSDLHPLCAYTDTDGGATKYSPTFDTVALEFRIANVATKHLIFKYAFATDEMNWNAQYNDAFGLFVKDGNGAFQNVAKIPQYSDNQQAVTVTNLKAAIASENYCGTANSMYATYNYNAKAKTSFSQNEVLPYDGITKLYTARADVTKGNTVTVKLVVADVSDNEMDSSVFIQSGSLSFPLDAPRVATLDEDACIDNNSGNASVTLTSAEDGTCCIVPTGTYANAAALNAVTQNKVTVDTIGGITSAAQNLSSFPAGEYDAYYVNHEGKISPPTSFYLSKNFSLTYNYNYKGAPAPVTSVKASGQILTAPADPVRENCIFGGWYTDAACKTPFSFTKTRMPAANLTLYAKWYRSGLDFNNPVSYTKDDGSNAENIATTADITDSADGWAWYVNGTTVDGKTYSGKVLVLSNFDLPTLDAKGVVVPDGTTVVLKNGTTNSIISGNQSYSMALECYTDGVASPKGLTIDGGGTLTATAGAATGTDAALNSLGIYSDGSIVINKGTITAIGGSSGNSSAGISSGYGSITINDGTVKAVGGKTSSQEMTNGSAGLAAAVNVTVNGGNITANGGKTGSGAYSMGILAQTGTAAFNDGTTNAAGQTAAVAAAVDITVNKIAITAPYNGKVGTSENYKTILSDTTVATSARISENDNTVVPSTTTTDSTVVVNGKPENVGKVTTTGNADGTQNNTVSVDSAKLETKVNAADKGSSVVVTVPTSTGAAKTQLVVKDVETMAAKDMTLDVKTGGVLYSIPATAIDTAAVIKTLGAPDATKVPVTVAITPVKQSDVKVAEGTPIADPVKFEVIAVYGGKSVDITDFGSYVSRTIELPDGVDPNKITTGIRVEDGEHVPTYVFKGADGKYLAKINSLTNSTYVVVYNEKRFADTTGKWYEKAVTEMASREIISGKTDTTFAGESSITRAEFAAILARALGLPEGGTNGFSDVASSAWCYGSVGAAVKYGIIQGYTDGSFKPGKNITREEAMAMVQRAAKVTGYAGTTGTLTGFSDAANVGSWAQSAVSFNVGSGLIQGNVGKLNPKGSITRAETAVVVLRLLQKSSLVDVRTNA